MADEQPPKKKRSKLKWFLILLLLLLLAGGGAAAWYFGLLDTFLRDKQPAPQTTEVSTPAHLDSTVPLPSFTVNLGRYIKIDLAVEVTKPEVTQDVAANSARIRDSVILLLSSKSYADIATPESKVLLKSEIGDRINTILGPGKIYQVLITDLIIQ